MPEPIFEPEFWLRRLLLATDKEQVHHAIYQCDFDRWRRIAERHRRILAGYIGPTDDVLDAGCGWGRLLSLLPYGWHGHYTGIDLSPDFLAIAREAHPEHEFVLGDLRTVFSHMKCVSKYDWAVLVSIRGMVIGNAGNEVWDEIRDVLRGCADRLLILEYDENDEGMVVG